MRAIILGWAVAGVAVGSPRVRENFNQGWNFARFGLMPGGGVVVEPGGEWQAAKASSEEKGKGNVAANAIDGDPGTRWCSSSGKPGEWLAVNLGGARMVDAVEIEWEKSERHEFRVEVMGEGGKWRKVAGWSAGQGDPLADSHAMPVGAEAGALRVVVDRATKDFWPSIAELRVLGPDGKAIKPVKPEGSSASPSEAGFDDSAWRSLDLPHDWGIEGPFDINLDGPTGKLPWVGIGWYRKSFTLPADDAGKRIFLDVDGAMMDAKVWLNGEWVGRWPYGYSSFRLDLSEHAKPGQENVLAIRLDNKDQSSRWYGGAGIYRDVWLVKTSPLHFAHNGVFAWTAKADDRMAVVEISTELGGKHEGGKLAIVHQLMDGEKSVARGAINTTDKTLQLEVKAPKLWSVESPFLYTLRSELVKEDGTIDVVETPFGIRTFEFTADRGFFLNGKPVYLKGVCQHHDLGAIGTAWNRRAAERQIEILQEMGCNSIRTAHNPPAPGLVDLCDEMGMILQAEAFDTWDHAKRSNDYARFFPEWHEKDLRLMVRNFRNSPSVMMWSAGNEIPGGYQNKPDGWKMADKLRRIMKDEDPTRPVTMGNNSPQAGKHLWKGVDLLGYNYKPHLYEKFHQEQPKTPVYGSETASCVSSRGIYFFPVDWNKAKGFFDFHVSSYDLYAPPWAMRPDLEFEAQDKTQPWNFGEYVWTGFDYLGEPTPFNKDMTNVLNFHSKEERERARKELEKMGRVKPPSRSSYFGIVDLAGMKKDRFHLYQARWRPELPVAHILPHWNWPERVGEVTPVHVYTSGDEAELFLNGKSLGRKKRGEFEYRLVWDEVKYQPGELKVIVYKDGNGWARGERVTSGKPAALKLSADRKAIAGDGLDLCYVTVDVVDANGVIVPTATNELQFKVEGAGEWVAADNGDPTDHVTFAEPHRKAFSGKCMAILRGKKGQSGMAVLKVASEGLPVASVELGVE